MLLSLREPVGQPVPLIDSGVDSGFATLAPALSPNGRWLAYQSNSSGRAEVYVRPFPDVNASREQISGAGGRYPAWSRMGASCSIWKATP